MARPAARDLTERELEVMHVFWRHGEATAVVRPSTTEEVIAVLIACAAMQRLTMK